MSESREWLTDGEIDGKIRKALDDEQKDWRKEVRAQHAKQDQLADKLIDGAQASLYTATLLVGDERLGIRGALPEIRDRLDALEAKAQKTEDLVETHHVENSQRLDGIERYTLRRLISCCVAWLTADGTEWKRIGWVLFAVMWLMTGLSGWFPGLRVWAVKLARVLTMGHQ